jgi:DNA-binding FadR family transcriptional regulator
LLENGGVARMRPGPGGGLIVTEPEVSSVASAAAIYLDYRRIGPDNLYTARVGIEPRCVELTIDRLTDSGREQLRRIIENESSYSPGELVAHSHELHAAVAELSGDPVLSLFSDVLLRLTGEYAPSPRVASAVPAVAGFLQRMQSDHAAIVAAILRRRPQAASRLMVEHLEGVRQAMRGR